MRLTRPVFLLSLVAALHAAAADSDPAERRAIAERVATLVEQSYAVPETAAQMAARLRQRLRAGAYDDLALPALAQALDKDLRSVADDHHMMLMYSARRLDDDFGKTASIIDPPADAAEASYRNYGVTKIERLPGNVGYFRLDRFFPPALAARTLTATVEAIHATDALIIDLRENVGGHPATVAFLCSYFIGPRTHVNDIVDRPNRRTTSFWTDPSVPGSRYLDKPVFVLVSSSSYSAAEEFAYNLQVLRRAKIVGAVTAGAANPSIPIRVHDHLAFYLPTGRAVNPKTGTNWEGVGVKPDLAAEPAAALDRAHLEALEVLVAGDPGHVRTAERKRAADEIRRKISPAGLGESGKAPPGPAALH